MKTVATLEHAPQAGMAQPNAFKRLCSSGLRRYVIQKYPGSAAEHGFRLGSLRGPLLWMMIGDLASRKHEAIKQYADRYSTLVETGTYRGDLVAACAASFERIVSIELSPELHQKAVQRFAEEDHIQLLHGDSSQVLPEVVNELDAPAVFWLDAHFSHADTACGAVETPVLDEITTILRHPLPHMILIDDAEDFTGANGYPSVQEVAGHVSRMRPGAVTDVINQEIIQIRQI